MTKRCILQLRAINPRMPGSRTAKRLGWRALLSITIRVTIRVIGSPVTGEGTRMESWSKGGMEGEGGGGGGISPAFAVSPLGRCAA